MAKRITNRKEDYSQWYLDVVKEAKLADHSPVMHGDTPQRVRLVGKDEGGA